MSKFFLQNPQDKRFNIYKKGQTGSYPIYFCYENNTSWLLGYNDQFQRVLVQFDHNSGTAIPAQTWPVPDNWEGEPEQISIELKTWNAIQSNTTNGSQISNNCINMLNNGDKLFLLGNNNDIIKEIVVQNGKLILI